MLKRWKVRGGMIFRTKDGKNTLKEGTQFDAEESEVEHMRTHIEPVPPPAAQSYRPDPDPTPRRRRGRPPKNRAISQPENTTAF